MKRGSILQYLVGSRRIRIVLVSAARYNPAHAVAAPVRERAVSDLAPAFLVPLTPRDWPTAAVIDLSVMRSINPAAVTGQAGQLTPETLRVLNVALRAYLDTQD